MEIGRILGLRGKLILLSILPPFLLLSLAAFLFIRNVDNNITHTLNNEYIKDSKTVTYFINNIVKSEEEINNPLLVELAVSQVTGFSPWIADIAIYTIEGDRALLIYPDRPDNSKQSLRSEELNYIKRAETGFIERQKEGLIEVITPMQIGSSRHVSVIIYTPLSSRNEKVSRHMSESMSGIFVTSAFLFAGITLILYLSFNRIIIEPVSRIRHVARQIAEGDPSVRIIMDRSDEIGELSIDINRMSDSLRARSAMLTKEIGLITTMKSIDRSILSSLTLSDLVHAISVNIKLIIPADLVTIALVDTAAGGFIRLVPGEGHQLTREFILFDDSHVIGLVNKTKKPFITKDFRDVGWRKPFEDRLLKSGILSAMVIPLISKGNLVGTLNLGSFSPDRFNDEHLSIALDLADEATIAIESSRLHERQKREVEVLSILLHIGGLLSSTISLDELMLKILDSIHKLIDVDTSSIMLLDDMKILKVKAARGLSSRYIDSEGVKLGEGIAGWVALHGKPLLIQDLVKNGGFINYTSHEKDIYSSVCIPISVKDQVIGVLSINSVSQEKRFNEDDLKLMTIFSSQAASAIENARLFDEVLKKTIELEASRFDSIKALAEALETKDIYTRGHSDRMVEYATKIADRLGLSEQEKEFMKYGAILHDIGKIGIPDHILNKPGRLNSEEYEMMKSHPIKGADIIREISFLAAVIPIVLYHQERYDGKGYPEGLAGEEIPIGARIISVLDAFDAMMSDRPYRPAPGADRAVEELKRCSGTQFDPKAVSAFLNILEEEKNARKGA